MSIFFPVSFESGQETRATDAVGSERRRDEKGEGEREYKWDIMMKMEENRRRQDTECRFRDTGKLSREFFRAD